MNSAHKTLPRNFKIEFDVIDTDRRINISRTGAGITGKLDQENDR